MIIGSVKNLYVRQPKSMSMFNKLSIGYTEKKKTRTEIELHGFSEKAKLQKMPNPVNTLAHTERISCAFGNLSTLNKVIQIFGQKIVFCCFWDFFTSRIEWETW